jgi:exonuclease VII large subunit
MQISHVISDAKKVKSGQQLKVRLAKGEIDVASK